MIFNFLIESIYLVLFNQFQEPWTKTKLDLIFLLLFSIYFIFFQGFFSWFNHFFIFFLPRQNIMHAEQDILKILTQKYHI